MADLVVQRPEGLYCAPGDFYIDPMRPVARAVITHAHADHARRGHGAYLATTQSEGVLKARLGALNLQTLAYGETVDCRGVRVSLHPAGHVLGSAQVRLEYGGQVWVVSGDYFVSAHANDRNPTCDAFEALRCDCFVTECTFGLPIYRWAPHACVMAQVNQWWQNNADDGRTSVLLGYSFGKAQSLLAGVDAGIGPIVVHSSVQAINLAYQDCGVVLPATMGLDEVKDRSLWRRALVVAPPTAMVGPWLKEAGEISTAFASGWMQLRSAWRRPGLDHGFVLSDHADWPGLLKAVAATGASRVIVTHGQEATLVRYLQQQGLDAGTMR